MKLPSWPSTYLLKTLNSLHGKRSRMELEQPAQDGQKAVQRGRSERRGESYALPYVEPLSDAGTKPADVFNILLCSGLHDQSAEPFPLGEPDTGELQTK